jgi:hypothetical protein
LIASFKDGEQSLSVLGDEPIAFCVLQIGPTSLLVPVSGTFVTPFPARVIQRPPVEQPYLVLEIRFAKVVSASTNAPALALVR